MCSGQEKKITDKERSSQVFRVGARVRVLYFARVRDRDRVRVRVRLRCKVR